MTEIGQIIVAIIALILLLNAVRRINTWRITRVYRRILGDLEQKGALSPSTAVPLPYDRRKLLRVGLRDFRPQALQYLISGNVVGVTEEGKYYIKDPAALKTDLHEGSDG